MGGNREYPEYIRGLKEEQKFQEQVTKQVNPSLRRAADLRSQWQADSREKPLAFAPNDHRWVDQNTPAKPTPLSETRLFEQQFNNDLTKHHTIEWQEKIIATFFKQLDQNELQRIQANKAKLLQMIEAKKTSLSAQPNHPEAAGQLQTELKNYITQKSLELITLVKAGVHKASEIPFLIFQSLPDKFYRAMAPSLVLLAILAACSPRASANSDQEISLNEPNVTENSNFNEETQSTQNQNNEQVAEPTASPEAIKAQQTALVKTSLEQNPNYNTSYVQNFEKINQQSLTDEGVSFLQEIGISGKKIVNDEYIKIGVNNYGILYAEALDNSTVVFNIKDNDGNYLIATKEEAINRLTQANPDAITGKTIDSFTLTTEVINGILVSLIDENGQQVMGVNPNTKQWEILIDGAFATAPTAEPTATTNENISDKGLVEVDQEVISAMVKDFAAGTTEFPSDLSREQYSAFIDEMNRQLSNKSIYVNATDKNGAAVVLYHDVSKNEMISLPGTYEDNKNVIDKNTFSIFVKIDKEPITNNLRYFDQKTQEWITIENSAGIDWKKIIDENNFYDGYFNPPTDEKLEYITGKPKTTYMESMVVGKPYDNIPFHLVQAILIDKNTISLAEAEGGSAYMDFNCLDMVFIRTDNFNQPLYGIRVFVGPQGGMEYLKEGKSETEHFGSLDGMKKILTKQLKANAIYFVGLSIDQTAIWQKWNRDSIDQIVNIVPTNEAYTAAVTDNPPSGKNILITSGVMIETD